MVSFMENRAQITTYVNQFMPSGKPNSKKRQVKIRVVSMGFGEPLMKEMDLCHRPVLLAEKIEILVL